MNRQWGFLLGIFGGLSLVLIKYFEIYEMFADAGVTWSILNVIFTILGVIGLFSVIFFSIIFILYALKLVIKKDK